MNTNIIHSLITWIGAIIIVALLTNVIINDHNRQKEVSIACIQKGGIEMRDISGHKSCVFNKQ